MKFSSCLQEYYSLKNNRNKTSDLINRLQEISENRGVKSFWLSILTGAVIGVLVSASNAFIDDNAEIWVVIIILAAILALISIVGWYSYSHLSPYDRFYLQEQEKELIEIFWKIGERVHCIRRLSLDLQQIIYPKGHRVIARCFFYVKTER